jgi:hypothetical protein
MNMDKVLGIIRHVLTFGGGFLVDADKLTEANLQNGVAAIVTLVGLAWSVYEKFKKA